MSACLKNPVSTSEQTPATPPPIEREKNGRFAKGNRGGPGNPFHRQVAANRKIIVETVSDEYLRAATEMLMRKSLEGDLAATKVLFQYAIGKPQSAVDPDRVDVDEWKLCRETNIDEGEGNAVMIDGTPIRFAINMAEVMEEVKYEKMKQEHAENERRIAEEAALAARAEEEFQRGVEESIRLHREEEAQRTSAPKPAATEEVSKPAADVRRPMTWNEILRSLTNGFIGGTKATTLPMAPPVANENGRDLPMANGDNGPTPKANGDIGEVIGRETPKANGDIGEDGRRTPMQTGISARTPVVIGGVGFRVAPPSYGGARFRRTKMKNAHRSSSLAP